MPRRKKVFNKKYFLFVLLPVIIIGFLWFYLMTLQGKTPLDFFEAVVGTMFLGLFMTGVVYTFFKKYTK